MCTYKTFFILATVSTVVLAVSNDQQYGMQRDQAIFRGQSEYEGNQGRFEDQNGNQRGFSGNQGGFQSPGGNQGDFGGQGGHGGQQLQLPFLRNVSEQARREYMAIVTNSSSTISQIEEQASEWAQTNGVSEQYEEFIANVTAKLEELKQNVTSVLTNLSSVLNSLESILENDDQTLSAQREAIESLRQESPAEVDALFFIAQEVAPKPQGRGGRNGTYRGQNEGQNGGFTGRSNFSGFSTTTASG